MYPQYLENVRVSDKKAVTENPAVQKKKQEIEAAVKKQFAMQACMGREAQA